MTKSKLTFLRGLAGAVVLFTTAAFCEPTLSYKPVDQGTDWILRDAPTLSPSALKPALNAYQHARKEGFDSKGVLTIVDYSKPSSEKRLWVLDLKHQHVLFCTYVAHGKGSGDQLHAKHFSNEARSDASSLGTFVTGCPYNGKHGYSLRLQGLEPGVNDHAASRAIVVHEAWYVGEKMVKQYGYVGRSWGCFALSPNVCHAVIHAIQGNTIIFAYYPDHGWLAHSTFANDSSEQV